MQPSCKCSRGSMSRQPSRPPDLCRYWEPDIKGSQYTQNAWRPISDRDFRQGQVRWTSTNCSLGSKWLP